MTVHLIKMCVGCDSVGDLRDWQAGRLLRGERLIHRTRNRPKRAPEVLAGGSLYWIIRGEVRVRQRIIGLDPCVDGEGQRFCAIGLDPNLVETVRLAHRPMQGWRYLEPADAPPDRDPRFKEERDEMPPRMLQQLRALGLL